ncbi:MAG: hypothetical protein K2W94_08305 [Alphaproteobacteria bacterium]|nr:hypothetical protein [Alphaproteobacteria bacterium]
MSLITKLGFKQPLVFKLISILAIVLFLFCLGGLYVSHEVKQWLRKEKATIEMSSWLPSLNWPISPSLHIGKTTIVYKNPQTSLEKIEFTKAIIDVDLLALFKNFFCSVTFPVKVDNLKISFKDKTYIKTEKTDGHIKRKWNSYDIDNLLIKSFQFGVYEYQEPTQSYQLAHLVIYDIEGKVNYQINKQLIRLVLEVPEATLQMPEGKSYSLKAEGELQLLNQEDVRLPVKGEMFLQVKSLFNFISHLHSVGMTQAVEKNLATVLGESLSTKDATNSHVSEEKRKDVILKIKFQPNAIYIGPLKVYP